MDIPSIPLPSPGVKQSGIYIISNTVNGKFYVGSSRDLVLRWSQHRTKLRRGAHYNLHLQAAWDQYGETVFTFAVLEECPVNDLIPREQYWIDTLDAVANGYNMRPIADVNIGIVHGPEFRARCANRLNQEWADPELRAQMSERQKERWGRDDERQKQSSRRQKHLSNPAARQLLAERTRAAWADPEKRARMLATRGTRRASAAYREARSHVARAQWADPEWRARMLQKRREEVIERKQHRPVQLSLFPID